MDSAQRRTDPYQGDKAITQGQSELFTEQQVQAERANLAALLPSGNSKTDKALA